MKIKLFKDKSDKWRWHILARNNKVLAVSEAYETRRKCLQTAEKVAWSDPMDIIVDEN